MTSSTCDGASESAPTARRSRGCEAHVAILLGPRDFSWLTKVGAESESFANGGSVLMSILRERMVSFRKA